MAADGSIVINTEIDTKDAQKELNKLQNQIEKMEKSLSEDTTKQSSIEAELKAAQDEALKTTDTIRRLKRELASERSVTSIDGTSDPTRYIESLSRQEQITSELQQQEALLKVQDKDAERLANEYTKIYDRVQSTTTQLDRAKMDAGALQQRLAQAPSALEMMGPAIERAQKSMNRFSLRLREVIRSALIFTVISQTLASFREWMGKVIKTNDEANAAFARLRGALLTLAQPLVNVIIPALTALANALTRVVTAAARIVSAFFGTTVEASAEAAENLYNETEALEGVGSAADEAGKSMASFDEINQLSGSGASGGSGGGGSVDMAAPDFSGPISDQLSAIVELFMGSALLALGAILTFSGVNIPLGITLMALGALAIWDAVSTNWEAIVTAIQGPLGAVFAIVGGALLVIGAALAFSGVNIPLGIALMAIGAAGLATAVAVNWEAIVGFIQGPMGQIVGIVSAGVLALGAVLAFSGAFIPLGIALMAVGAAGLATTVALNWDSIATALQGPIGLITAAVSAALLALGACLAFSGVALPLGLALMAAGAVGLAATVAVNWDAIVSALQGEVGQLVAIVSASLLLLGVILLFTGVAAPLGLGLMAAGAVGLAVAIVPNWNFILDAISNAWDNFTTWWDNNAAQFFTLDYWLGLGQDMLDGLFNGLSSIGKRITQWGSDFIDGVCNFFGINSPSKEFESLGGYMMSGLQIGVSNNSASAVSAFSVMFNSVLALCNDSVTMMQAAYAAFILYLAGEFYTQWGDTWNGMYDTAHTNIQSVISDIDALNARLAAIERNITITITTVYRTVGSSSGGSSTSSSSRSVSTRALSAQNIPALARGAVIPPNREFLAVLGDQKQGTNIEAPLSTIEQAVANVMNRMGYGGEQTVILQVDKDQLGKVVYRLNKAETRRIGVNLAGV